MPNFPDANLLGDSTSPYLLQHKENPVHWRQWGADAFAEARATGKAILLSVGYAACHWCHVMAHESFEDAETAALMNRLFVNVKLDREERPDLDHIYQTALALLGQQGGWPLTMFLDADGRPFWGGTYFPKDELYGRPSFKRVLEEIARIYAEEPAKVENNRAAIGSALEDALARSKPGAVTAADLDRAAGQLLGAMDPIKGGLKGAEHSPKFPQTNLFELLIRGYLRTGHQPFRTSVLTTLTAICNGGIYDHAGGGFARYSTDQSWLAPHFEKMLYDNAQLLSVLGAAYHLWPSPILADRMVRTVEFLERELRLPSGAYASSLDADSEGEEGRFYVWSLEEIRSVLGTDADELARVYAVSPEGNWESTNILNRLSVPHWLGDEKEAALRRSLDRLLEHRSGRIRPGLDDKMLTDWNGLAIEGITRAAIALGRTDWIDIAERVFAAVLADAAEDGKLAHSVRAGVSRHGGLAEDYANMALAALALAQATQSDTYLAHAKAFVATLDREFWSDEKRSYFMSPVSADDLVVRPVAAADTAVPSASGTMVTVLSALFRLTHEPAYRERLGALVDGNAGTAAEYPFGYATFLNGIDFDLSGYDLTVVSDAREDLAPFRDALLVRDPVNGTFTWVSSLEALREGSPARSGGPLAAGATGPAAYYCRLGTCFPPVAKPADVIAYHPGPHGLDPS